MLDETGGNATSAVPFGTKGTSTVAGADPEGTPTTPCVVSTSAGAWMTPIVGGVFEPGRRSSSEREKPYARRAPTATKPTVNAIRASRARRFEPIVSTTTTTLSR